ncbi:hypothetical protein [Mycobacterium sp. 23]|uniref:hypothetical protein n=1 Tax=Mycobacterium sp. 23 TaxID=3400424 RepID=UPI003AADE327
MSLGALGGKRCHPAFVPFGRERGSDGVAMTVSKEPEPRPAPSAPIHPEQTKKALVHQHD